MTDLSAFRSHVIGGRKMQPGLQLFRFPTPNVTVAIALEETGLAYEAHRVTLTDADVKSPAFCR